MSYTEGVPREGKACNALMLYIFVCIFLLMRGKVEVDLRYLQVTFR
jgi:hypothetical protein